MRYEITPSVYDLTHRFESFIIKYRATRGIFIRRGDDDETVSWIVPSIPSDETTGYRVVRTARSRAFKPEEISECLIYRLRRIGAAGDVGERDGPEGMDNRTGGPLSFCAYTVTFL